MHHICQALRQYISVSVSRGGLHEQPSSLLAEAAIHSVLQPSITVAVHHTVEDQLVTKVPKCCFLEGAKSITCHDDSKDCT